MVPGHGKFLDEAAGEKPLEYCDLWITLLPCSGGVNGRNSSYCSFLCIQRHCSSTRAGLPNEGITPLGKTQLQTASGPSQAAPSLGSGNQLRQSQTKRLSQ